MMSKTNNNDDGPDLSTQLTIKLSFFLWKFSFSTLYFNRVRTPESLAFGMERISGGDLFITNSPQSGQVLAEFWVLWYLEWRRDQQG